jgi:hypothetical protein
MPKRWNNLTSGGTASVVPSSFPTPFKAWPCAGLWHFMEHDMTEAQPTPVPIPVFDMAKWEADRAREAQIDAEILPKNKAALFDALS